MPVGGSSGQLVKAREQEERRAPDARPQGRQGAYVTYPRFLDGKAPEDPADATTRSARKALADYLTAEDNYWFSAAYVNRIWNALLGQAFYERVDDLSPKGEVVFPAVAHRLAAAFRGSRYDTKDLIRAIVTSKAYQREVRLGEAADEHLRFAARLSQPASRRGLVAGSSRVLGPLPESPPAPRLVHGGVRLRSFAAVRRGRGYRHAGALAPEQPPWSTTA